MRKSREAAAESRRNIVETAAKLLRERGLGVGLADIMAAAGLNSWRLLPPFRVEGGAGRGGPAAGSR